MKRIISLVLAVAMIAGSFALTALASEDTIYTEAENFAFSLGIIDKESYDSDALLTRAEFAEIVARFLGLKDPNAEYNAWNDATFGADDKDEPAQGISTYAFTDIDVSLPQFEAINAVCSYGYMNGVTNTHFLPNYSITLGSAVKVLVCMLGYEPIAQLKGGYPVGYMTVGDMLGVRDGVKGATDDFITYGDCLQMLYNILEVGVYEFSSINEDGVTYERGATFLNSVMKICTVEGVMTDNGITALYGSSKVGANFVVVDGVRIYTDDASFHSTRYLGREVVAYYRENVSGKNELVHMEIMEDDSVSFAPDMFISLKSGKLTYEDERGRVVSETVDPNATLIYNNAVKSEYKDTIFSFPSGAITLLKSGGSNIYDIIVIEDYAVGKVKKVDLANEVMYIESMYKSLSSSKSISLESGSDKVLKITDIYGNALTLAEIKTDSIVSIISDGNGSYKEIIVSTDMAKAFNVESYTEDENSIIVYGGESTYEISNTDYMIKKPVISAGEKYDIFFDFGGKVAWIEKSVENTSGMMAFLIDAAGNSNGFNVEYAIKLYTQNGKIETYDMGERIVLNNSSKDTKDILSEIQSAKEEIILYTLNDDNSVKSITTPLDMGEEDPDGRGWYHISPRVRLSKDEGEADSQWTKYVEENGMKFSQRGTSFNKTVHYVDGSSKVFSVPSSKADYENEKLFSTISDSFSATENQTVNAYAAKPNAMLAEAISWSTSNLSGQKVSWLKVFLISKISKGLADDEEVTMLEGYVIDGNQWTYTKEKLIFTEDTVFVDEKATPGIIDPNADGYDINANGPARLSDLEVGDIMRYSTNAVGEIVSARVIYDCSTGNTFTSGSDPRDYFMFYEGGISAGYPLYIEGNYVKLSADLPHTIDMADLSVMRDPFKIMACDVKANTVFVVEDGVRGKNIRKGSIEDIETYEDTGILDASEYDKVVVPLYWGKTIGTIIYK